MCYPLKTAKGLIFAGNISTLTETFFQQLSEDLRAIVVPFAPTKEPAGLPSNVKFCSFSIKDDEYKLLFDTYNFSAAFFLSAFLDGGKGNIGEHECLLRTLNACDHAHVDKFVLLTGQSKPDDADMPQDIERSKTENPDSPSLQFAIHQQEELIGFFAKEKTIKTIVLRLPYLFDSEAKDSFLSDIFYQIRKGSTVKLPFARFGLVDAVSQKDLANLLGRIAEETEDESASHNVGSGYRRSCQQFAEELKALRPDATVHFSREAAPLTVEYPISLRKAYGWIPFDNLMKQIPQLYDDYRQRTAAPKSSLWQRIKRLLLSSSKIVKYFELVVFFALVETMDALLGTNLYYQFIDLRLLFVVIMGTMHGLRFGLLSATLAGLSLFVAYLTRGTEASLIFLNVENWLPFAFYLLAGSVTGYVTDKKAEEIAAIRQDQQLLTDKYLFLNDVYLNAIQNKNLYKNQIMGFDDSFGRIFDAVQQLDSVESNQLQAHALALMEEILNNRTIAIYALSPNSNFCRLSVCSCRVKEHLRKSVNLSDHPDLLEAINSKQVFRNTTASPEEPAYACGIRKGDQTVLIVSILNAGHDQYDLRFENLLSILCGLLEMSFIRALEYETSARADHYIGNSDILQPERFQQILLEKTSMKDDGIFEFVDLALVDDPTPDLYHRISTIIRSTDDIGIGSDGKLHVILNQADSKTTPVVIERINDANIECQILGE